MFSLETVTFLNSTGAVLQNAPQFVFKLKFWANVVSLLAASYQRVSWSLIGDLSLIHD